MEKVASGKHGDPHLLSDSGNAFNGDHFNRSLHEVVGFYIRLEVRDPLLLRPTECLFTCDDTIFRSSSCMKMLLLRFV
jgi:hypothetical protein